MKTQTKLIGLFTGLLFGMLLLWGRIAYVFFMGNAWDSAYRADTLEFNQYTDFFKEKADNISNYGNKLILNEKLQDFLKEIDIIENSTDKNFYIAKFFREFSDEINIDSAIQSIVLITDTGESYWSKYPYTNEFIPYWEMLLEQRETDFPYYSAPYEIFSGFTKDYVLSYVVEVKDIENLDKTIGYLVLNLHFENWGKICERMAEYYDAVCWESEGAVFYLSSGEAAEWEIKERREEKQYYAEIYKDKSYRMERELSDLNWTISVLRKYENIVDMKKYVLTFIIFFVMAGITIVCLLLILSDITYTKPIRRLVKNMSYITEGKFEYEYRQEATKDMEYLEKSLWHMASRLKILMEERIAYEKNVKDLEMEVLLLQINPHFIYNTLNTVIYLARKEKCPSIENLMKSFMVLLKDVLPNKDEFGAFVTVERELYIIEHYCTVQNFRYRDMIELHVSVDEEALGKYIPKVLLQPLVENAILHGIFPKEEKGNIWVMITCRKNVLTIIVENDGESITQEMINKIDNGIPLIKTDGMARSIGLENVRHRLFLYYENPVFEIEAVKDGGTRVKIVLTAEPAFERNNV